MKKLFTIALAALSIYSADKAEAQGLAFSTDTATANTSGSTNVGNNINNTSGSPMTIEWKVPATNFPADWLANIGMCDNYGCYPDVWPTVTREATYPNGVGDFHMTIDLSTVSTPGPYYMRVRANNKTGPDTAWATFIVSKTATGVNVVKSNSDVVLYPNPATNAVNVVYDAGANIKNIAIYSIIGRQMSMYKVTGANSASLNIDNIPSGIYFVRLLNAHGEVVATRKFTKQ